MIKAFFAYPAHPAALGQCIRAAKTKLQGRSGAPDLHLWEEEDIFGRPLVTTILADIDACDVLIADVTKPNVNVTFEIGYAIASNKRIYLLVNKGLKSEKHIFSQIGIFDTLGYREYENSDQLCSFLPNVLPTGSIKLPHGTDERRPVFILETPVRDDTIGRLIARVKFARIQYRSFIAKEEPRLAASYAIDHVAKSIGVVVPLLSLQYEHSEVHNIRGAFVAGLAHALDKELLILQSADGPAPIDVRDFVRSYRDPKQIDEYVHAFAYQVHAKKYADVRPIEEKEELLRSISVGDPVAENEFQSLVDYYVKTDQFEKVVRGEASLVVGRKGTGKTALFFQARDRVRRKINNVVLDLKPEGYQLTKLREEVLEYLSDGAKSHLLVAFWEYLLYMELAHKILRDDRTTHLRKRALHQAYEKLQQQYETAATADAEADFSERLLRLSDEISSRYSTAFQGEPGQRLTTNEVTELLHSDQLPKLRDALSTYLREKEQVWLFFDNLDKGWTAFGPSQADLTVLKCLIEASRKLQRQMTRADVDFHSVIFIRNDVFELLMKSTPDFGKENTVSLDWKRPEMLAEILRRRLARGFFQEGDRFDVIWSQLVTSHVDGEESSAYLIRHTLMRPRALIKLFGYCRGNAVNMGHPLIEESDLEKGVADFSDEMLIDADNELRDIEPTADGLLYRFIGEKREYRVEELDTFIKLNNVPSDRVKHVRDYLLYYGFFGIRQENDEVLYIYDVGYDFRKMMALVEKRTEATFVMNDAFLPALGIRW
jgi:hypothetical protein